MRDQCSQGRCRGWLALVPVLPAHRWEQSACPSVPLPNKPSARARNGAPGDSRRCLFQGLHTLEREVTEIRAPLHATVLFAHGSGARVFLMMTNSFPEAVQISAPIPCSQIIPGASSSHRQHRAPGQALPLSWQLLPKGTEGYSLLLFIGNMEKGFPCAETRPHRHSSIPSPGTKLSH